MIPGLYGLCDADLVHDFWATYTPDSFRDVKYERYLVELGRRGGPSAERAINKALERAQKYAFEETEFDIGVPRNLELMVALRRAQKMPAPLVIHIDKATPEETIFPDLPEYAVRIVNDDIEGVAVGFTFGGDNRAGRAQRWRFDVVDSEGCQVPPIRLKGFIFGGGLFMRKLLARGEEWGINLPMRDYIEVPGPGRYRLRVQYHDQVTIDGRTNVNDLVVTTSPWVDLVVRPRRIEITQAEEGQVKRWIGALKADVPVKIICHAHDDDWDAFISPKSPARRLLDAKWKAVPLMIDALADEDTSAVKRAWLLGLLYSTTGCNDPRYEDGVLPTYKWIGDGNGQWGSKIKDKDQRRFIARWTKWASGLEVVRE